MYEMKPLVRAINTIVPQPLPTLAISAAEDLYDMMYSPIEEYDPETTTDNPAPTISEMNDACSYIVECFEFGRMEMICDYIRDLLMYRLLCVCGAGTTNMYQAIMDEIVARWADYTFAGIDEIITFTEIAAL